jgi:hypothetical protein
LRERFGIIVVALKRAAAHLQAAGQAEAAVEQYLAAL